MTKYGINIPKIREAKYQIDPRLAQNAGTPSGREAYNAARDELHGRIRTDQQEALTQYLRSQGVEDPSQGSIESVSLRGPGDVYYYADGSGNTVEIPQYLEDPNMFADIANNNPNIDMNDPSQVVDVDWTTVLNDTPVPPGYKRVPGVNVDPENDDSSISGFIQSQEQQRLEALAQQDSPQEDQPQVDEPVEQDPVIQEPVAEDPPAEVPEQASIPQEIAAQDTAETEQAIAEDPAPEEPVPDSPAEEVVPQATEPPPVEEPVAVDDPAPQEAPDVDIPEPVETTTELPTLDPEVPDIEPPTPTDIPPVDVPEVATDTPVPEPTPTETPTEEIEAPVAEPDVEVPTDDIEVPAATDIPDDPSIPEVDIPDPTEDAPVATGDPVTDIASIVLKTLAAAAITYGGAAIAKRIKQQGNWNQANIVQGEQAGPTLGAMMTPVIKGLYQAKDPKERNRVLKGSLKQAKVAYQTGNSKWVPLRSWEDLRQAASALQSGEVTAVARQ